MKTLSLCEVARRLAFLTTWPARSRERPAVDNYQDRAIARRGYEFLQGRTQDSVTSPSKMTHRACRMAFSWPRLQRRGIRAHVLPGSRMWRQHKCMLH